MEQEAIEITKQNPELIKDVKLFKLILTPLELYTLQYFIDALRPLNIRELYQQAIFVLFDFTFFSNAEIQNQSERLKSQFATLLNAGYGGALVSPATQKKVMKEVYGKKDTMSETEFTEKCYEKLREHKSRVPSYDKFQKIFKNFEGIGIIYKRARQGKIILYGLNPKFYNLFKDKIEEIKKL